MVFPAKYPPALRHSECIFSYFLPALSSTTAAMNRFNDTDLMTELETNVPNIDKQLFNDHLNPDITGTFGIFRELLETTMLSGKITQFINSDILHSDKEIEYIPELSDSKDNSKNVLWKHIEEIPLALDKLDIEQLNQSVPGEGGESGSWVSRCGISCGLCCLRYSSKQHLDSHFSLSHALYASILYRCSLCSAVDANYNRFRNHCYRHFVKGRITCHHCPSLRFTQEFHLLGHHSLFHPEETEYSDVQLQLDPKLITKQERVQDETSQEYIRDATEIYCNVCKQNYTGQKYFCDHFKLKHSRSQVIYTCTSCHSHFKDFATFKAHRDSQHEDHSEQNSVARLAKSGHARAGGETTAPGLHASRARNNSGDTKIVQKDVDIENCTNFEDCVNLENNIRDIFTPEKKDIINLLLNYENLFNTDMDKSEEQKTRDSQSAISESDISDLISNLGDIPDLDSEAGSWREQIGILCACCRRKFSQKSVFDIHCQEEHGTPALYTCPLCHCNEPDYERFRGHCYRHFTQGRFKCCYCSSRFPKLNRLLIHIKSVHPDSYRSDGLPFENIHHRSTPSGADSNWAPPSIHSVDTSSSAEDRKGRVNGWLSRYGIFCCKCKMKYLDRLSFQTHYQEIHPNMEIIYTCSSCKQEFSKYKCFSNHCLRHFNRDSYECKFCPRKFCNYRSLSAHEEDVHSNAGQEVLKLVCKSCNKVFLTHSRLERHCRTVCGFDATSLGSSKPSSSPLCESSADTSVDAVLYYANSDQDKTCTSSSMNDSHIEHAQTCISEYNSEGQNTAKGRNSSNWLFRHGILCVKCNLKFPGKDFIMVHYEKIHPQSEVCFTCSICLQDFSQYKKFISHNYRHFVKGRFQCHYCPIFFSHHHQLVGHLKAFSSDTNHKTAEGAGRQEAISEYKGRYLYCITFLILFTAWTNQTSHYVSSNSINNDLMFHVRRHWVEGTILCELCEEEFRSKSLFEKHYHQHHPDAKLVYTCLCKKNYENYEHFRNHRYLHFVKGMFKCHFCSKSFAKPSRLASHIQKVHPNKKPDEAPLTEVTAGSLCQLPTNLDHNNSEEVHPGPTELCTTPTDHLYDDAFHSMDELNAHSPVCAGTVCDANAENKFEQENTNVYNEGFYRDVDSLISISQQNQDRPQHLDEPHYDAIQKCHDYVRNKVSNYVYLNDDAENNNGSVSCQIMCGECRQVFSSKGLVDEHMTAQHGGTASYACTMCCRQYKTYRSFMFHRYRHIGRFKCGVCPSRFPLVSALSTHMRRQHGLDSPRFPCALCPKGYRTEPGLKLHIRSQHSKSAPTYSCRLCNILLYTKNGYLTHVESHRPGRKFTCDVCGRNFKQKTNLVVHMRSKHGEGVRALQEALQCRVCQRWCSSAYRLRRHAEVHRRRAYPCGQCGKSFLTPSKLAQHCNTHTGQRPFACAICPKTFASAPNLLKHRRLVHKKAPRLYPENCKQPATSAQDDSIQSVITTSENVNLSVINNEVKGRNKDIVSCSEMSTDSSLELPDYNDSLEPSGSAGLPDIPNSNTPSEEEELNRNTDSSATEFSNKELYNLIDSLPDHWPERQEEALRLGPTESSEQIDFQNEIFLELAENVIFPMDEESPPNIDVSDEIETEELLRKNLSYGDHSHASGQHTISAHLGEPPGTTEEWMHGLEPSPGSRWWASEKLTVM